MKINALIIDDEINGAESLQRLIELVNTDVNIMSLCHSGKVGIEKIKSLNPDVIFLDVDMPGMSGFEMLDKIENKNFEIIFTTAYDEYAIKAFKVNAVDYLLKPIDSDDLVNAIQKVKKRLEKKEESPLLKIEQLLQAFKPDKAIKDRLPIITSDGIIFVLYEDVQYLIASSNYTDIFLENGKKYTATKTLKDFEDTLPGTIFYRIHNAHMINIKHVAKYVRGDGGYVVMKNGENLEVSRRKKVEFLDKLGA
jgi:two-component system LytT family response regulator